MEVQDNSFMQNICIGSHNQDLRDSETGELCPAA